MAIEEANAFSDRSQPPKEIRVHINITNGEDETFHTQNLNDVSENRGHRKKSTMKMDNSQLPSVHSNLHSNLNSALSPSIHG